MACHMPNYVLQYDLSTNHIENNGHDSSNVYKYLARRLRRRGWTNTSTLVGDAMAKPSLKHTTTPSLSRLSSKRTTDLVFSSDSSTSVTSISPGCAEKKKCKRRKTKVPTENHLKIRAVVDAGRKWELDLEEVHGLTDEQGCVVVSMAAQYYKDTFPPAKGDRFLELAKEGWKHVKELDRLNTLYPECDDQTSINGKWIML